MKFLCLHGSLGSAKNFEIQLAPFVKKMAPACNTEYKFISGRHLATPPPGYEEYFGEGPLYRYIPFDGIRARNDTTQKLSEFPTQGSAEEKFRELVDSGYGTTKSTKQGAKDAIHAILDAIDEDPEIEGILGYSEGATVAGSLIAEERRRWQEEGIPRRIKCGVFFAGWPPLSIRNGEVSLNLADEEHDLIDVPTCHIIGCNDPYLDGAMALFSMCDEDTAELFDHGKGHTLPRDSATLDELVDVMNRVVERARSNRRDSGDVSCDEDDTSSSMSSESPGISMGQRSSSATSVESFFAKDS